MINSKNRHILGDSMLLSISSIAKTLNALRCANFSRISNIGIFSNDNKGKIRTNVLGPGFIEQTFLEQMFLEQMFEGENVAFWLMEKMTDCKNFFWCKSFLKFTDCKSIFNYFYFLRLIDCKSKKSEIHY